MHKDSLAWLSRFGTDVNSSEASSASSDTTATLAQATGLMFHKKTPLPLTDNLKS